MACSPSFISVSMVAVAVLLTVFSLIRFRTTPRYVCFDFSGWCTASTSTSFDHQKNCVAFSDRISSPEGWTNKTHWCVQPSRSAARVPKSTEIQWFYLDCIVVDRCIAMYFLFDPSSLPALQSSIFKQAPSLYDPSAHRSAFDYSHSFECHSCIRTHLSVAYFCEASHDRNLCFRPSDSFHICGMGFCRKFHMGCGSRRAPNLGWNCWVSFWPCSRAQKYHLLDQDPV